MPYRVLKQSKLRKEAKPGTIIYGFIGATYGVLSLDNRRGPERPYGAFTLGPTSFDGPFFTMPLTDVEQIQESGVTSSISEQKLYLSLASPMNEFHIGQKRKIDFNKFRARGFLLITDGEPPHLPRARIFDPAEYSFNPLKDITKRQARDLATVIYAAYPQATTTLTVRNGAIDFAPALFEAGRFDKIQSNSEEVMRIKDDILFTLRDTLCDSKRLFSFRPNSVVIAKLDRSALGDYDAKLIGLFLMSVYKGQLIVPNLGFFGVDLHANLIAQKRLVAGVDYLDQLPEKLRTAALTVSDIQAHGALYRDAVVLAELRGLRRQRRGEATG